MPYRIVPKHGLSQARYRKDAIEQAISVRAYSNMYRFMADVKATHDYEHVSSALTGDAVDGYVPYRLIAEGQEFEIKMPGVPLNEVRYMEGGVDSPRDYCKMWVDDHEGNWSYALHCCGREAY